ncbi:MAG: insulinase family protein [Bacteroidia bacterium]
MNNIRFITLLLTLISSTLFAQELPPAPGPAPEVKMSEPYRFELPNGLKVILVENHKLPTVAYQLYVNYNPIVEGDKAGMLQAMGDMLAKGTSSMDEEAFAKSIDMIGANFSTSPRGAYAQGLSKHRETLAKLMSSAVIEPAFPAPALDREVKQALSGLAVQANNPDAIAARVSGVLKYGMDHPYGEFDSEDTWKNIAIEDVKGLYNTYFKPNISYLVMVGDLSQTQAMEIAKNNFGSWQRGDVPAQSYSKPSAPEARYVALVDRASSAQSKVDVTYPIELKPGDKDIFAIKVLDQVLGGGALGRLFQNLREDHGFTYGCYSSIESDNLVGEISASASVRTSVTDSAVQEILNEFERLRQEPVTAKELSDAKNYLMGGFARSLERASTVANFTLNVDRYNLPKDYYQNYLKNLEAVTIEDVQRAARRIINPEKAIVMIVGKGSEIAEGLAKFGEVRYMSPNAEMQEAPKRELPKGVTAKNIIAKYVSALGGESKLEKIKDITMKYEATFMEQPAKLKVKYLLPNMSYNKFVVENEEGEELFSQSSKTDGKAAYESNSQSGRKNLEGTELQKAIMKANPFPFVNYAEAGYTVELVAMERVDGKDAFALRVVNPVEEVSTYYFDAASGFLVRMEREVEAPGGQKAIQSVSYGDYKAVEGVMFAHSRMQEVGPTTIPFVLKEIKINTGLKKKDFSVKE